jgi:hypothetical protein
VRPGSSSAARSESPIRRRRASQPVRGIASAPEHGAPRQPRSQRNDVPEPEFDSMTCYGPNVTTSPSRARSASSGVNMTSVISAVIGSKGHRQDRARGRLRPIRPRLRADKRPAHRHDIDAFIERHVSTYELPESSPVSTYGPTVRRLVLAVRLRNARGNVSKRQDCGRVRWPNRWRRLASGATRHGKIRHQPTATIGIRIACLDMAMRCDRSACAAGNLHYEREAHVE